MGELVILMWLAVCWWLGAMFRSHLWTIGGDPLSAASMLFGWFLVAVIFYTDHADWE